MNMVVSTLSIIPALILSPLLLGIINRTKAFFAGRHGQPVLQLYFDIVKLMKKGSVYSTTSSAVFRLGPVMGLAAALTALTIVPLGHHPGILHFPGDILLLAYLLAMMRFATVMAALDTGSAFEGMGSSREVFFSALAEPAMLLGFAALARMAQSLTMADMLHFQAGYFPETLLIAAAFVVVFLCENSRIPIDDPNTHLELTMIHEVMILDHGGPDLAIILYSSAIKLWILGALVVELLTPSHTGLSPVSLALISIVGIFLLAVLVGILESVMARLRMNRVFHLLTAASVASVLALLLTMR